MPSCSADDKGLKTSAESFNNVYLLHFTENMQAYIRGFCPTPVNELLNIEAHYCL